MKKQHWTYLLLINLSLLSLLSCTRKELDIEVIQDECKRFNINSPAYQRIDDPCNGGVRFRAQVSFQFNRSSDCLNRVNNYPVFYESDNGTIIPQSYTKTVERADIQINDGSANYIFEAVFADQTAADFLNHIILDFNTTDELSVESNTLQIRMNTGCSTLDPSTYDVNQNQVNIPRNQSVFTIRLWDNAAEDGDIVSVYLNGSWIIENHSLLNAGTNFNFSTNLLIPGANDLVVFALNEGSSGPNTVSIAVNGTEIPNFSPGLLTGEAVRINF